MRDVPLDLKPSTDLALAEHEAGAKLAQAERDDEERQAAVAARTRQPPGPSERPFLDQGRGRAPQHEERSVAINAKVQEVIALQARADTLDDEMDDLDGEADPLELRFWNQWNALPSPDSLGRRSFYPNSARSDYGNPSFDRNRAWWDRAARIFRDETLVLPPAVLTFRADVLSVADRYGVGLDTLRAALQAKLEGWKELTELCRQARKGRRITRARLKDDFDGQMRWVDELVAPPSVVRRKPPEGGGEG